MSMFDGSANRFTANAPQFQELRPEQSYMSQRDIGGGVGHAWWDENKARYGYGPQTGGNDPAQQVSGPQMGGNLPPQGYDSSGYTGGMHTGGSLPPTQFPPMQTGGPGQMQGFPSPHMSGNDPARQWPGMQTGGSLPPTQMPQMSTGGNLQPQSGSYGQQQSPFGQSSYGNLFGNWPRR